MRFYESIYTYGTYFIYVLYALTFLGVWNNAPQYLDTIQYFFQLFIGLILVINNNPITFHKYSRIDKQISFTAGVLLLATTTLSGFINRVQGTLHQ